MLTDIINSVLLSVSG